MKRARRGTTESPDASFRNGHAHSSSFGNAADARAGMSSSFPAIPPLSLSILGVEPLDEFILHIADFLHPFVKQYHDHPSYPNAKVEVEAKIGIIRDRTTNARINLPIEVETVLHPEIGNIRFESDMSVKQHKHFNTLLNHLKTGSSNIEYEHLYLTDSFYASGRSDEKIRVTRNDKTGDVLETMTKIRLGDINIFSPKRDADWRVSINLEVPVPHPLGSATHTRKKDRLSYSHEEFKIDLTQVTSTTSPNAPPRVSHELELEISRSELLVSTALMRDDPNVSEHERSAFDELIRAFVNNARILVRNACPGWQ